jgi:hypothetical protein
MRGDVYHHPSQLNGRLLWDERGLLEANDHIELESLRVYHEDPLVCDLEKQPVPESAHQRVIGGQVVVRAEL